jgi:hypothetical protein
MKNGVKCLQGTDGCGFYGIDTIDEQLALTNLVGLTNEEFEQMKQVEKEVISHSKKYFEKKNKEFNKFLAGRDIKVALMELQQENLEKGSKSTVTLRLSDKLDAGEELASIIKPLPTDKFPIIVAGGSFNAQEIKTSVDNKMAEKLEQLINVVDEKKVYFVIGHKMEAYEKTVLDTIKKLNKNIEVYAFVPKMISKEEKETIMNSNITGARICIETTAFGIYKSFNYEIFERRESIVIAFSGNSPVSNLVQEAKNGKGKAKIFVNEKCEILKEKAKSLEGYVKTFDANDNLKEMVMVTHPELEK